MNNDRLKFRVWSIKHNCYQEYCSFDLTMEGRLIDGAGNTENNGREDLIIEQCTGLKDKNGNLIYDGDIIRWYGTHKTQDYKVVWVNAGWCLKDLRTMTTIAMTGLEASEIIGNIHE